MNQEIRLTQGELGQVITLERIKKRDLTQGEAAKLLKISERQVRRKYKRYCEEGAIGVIHRGKGKKSNRAVKEEMVTKIIETLNKNYLEKLGLLIGPTFLSEKLKEDHEIKIDHETLRRLMLTAGLWEVRKKKQKKRHVWREPKHHKGELVQGDGSEHIWFGEGYSTLVAFIDDATSEIMAAKFVTYESTEALASLTLTYVKKYGRPLAFYTDRGSTYKVNHKTCEKTRKTQYERILKELDTELIHALSPQAKGRGI